MVYVQHSRETGNSTEDVRCALINREIETSSSTSHLFKPLSSFDACIGYRQSVNYWRISHKRAERTRGNTWCCSNARRSIKTSLSPRDIYTPARSLARWCTGEHYCLPGLCSRDRSMFDLRISARARNHVISWDLLSPIEFSISLLTLLRSKCGQSAANSRLQNPRASEKPVKL